MGHAGLYGVSCLVLVKVQWLCSKSNQLASIGVGVHNPYFVSSGSLFVLMGEEYALPSNGEYSNVGLTGALKNTGLKMPNYIKEAKLQTGELTSSRFCARLSCWSVAFGLVFFLLFILNS
jgi:hypothetical protein